MERRYSPCGPLRQSLENIQYTRIDGMDITGAEVTQVMTDFFQGIGKIAHTIVIFHPEFLTGVGMMETKLTRASSWFCLHTGHRQRQSTTDSRAQKTTPIKSDIPNRSSDFFHCC